MSFCDLVIVTKDHPHLLAGCLNSLTASGAFINDLIRVIVVNNGSAESVAGMRAATADAPAVTWLQMPSNLGWEGGLAAGVAETTAPIVGLLNDDIICLPGSSIWLRYLLASFRDPAVGAVGPCSNYVMGAQSLFWTPPQITPSGIYEVPYLINFFCLVRRQALMDVGGIDTAFHNGGDDLDQSIRLRKAGYKLLAHRYTFVYHHGSQTGVAEHGADWNSPAHLDPIQHQLIRKHGFLAWWNCVYGPVTPYEGSANPGWPGGSEEDTMRPWIPVDGTVLELGCGPSKLVPHSVGVDKVPEGQPVAQVGSQPSAATVNADLNERLPYPDAVVRGIVAKQVLEHLIDPLAALQEWHRVLEPRGKVIIGVPDQSQVSGIALNPEHVHVFTQGSLRHLAETAGFKTTHEEIAGISAVYVGEKNGLQ